MTPPFAPERITIDKQFSGGKGLHYGDTVVIERDYYTNPDGQLIGTLRVDPTGGNPDRILIAPTMLDNRLEDFLVAKTVVQAIEANAEIRVVGMPGVEYDFDPQHPQTRIKGVFQTKQQFREALKGNYLPTVTAQIEALSHTHGGIDTTKPHGFLLQSLSSVVGMAMIDAFANERVRETPEINSVYINEPIASGGRLRYRDLARILYNLALPEAKRDSIYSSENKLFAPDAPRPFEQTSSRNQFLHTTMRLRQMPASYMTAIGVRVGLPDLVRSALQDPHSPSRIREADFTLTHFANSTVSSEQHVAHLAHVLRESGAEKVRHLQLSPADDDPTPLGHSALNSFSRLANYSRIILARQQVEEVLTHIQEQPQELVA